MWLKILLIKLLKLKMRNFILFIFLILTGFSAIAQDFNARVTVDNKQVQTTGNTQIFKNLETSISEFLNTRKWSTDKILAQEKIEITLNLRITKFDDVENFEAVARIQASRPVYGSSYNSVILNQEDVNWKFVYKDFMQMDFREGTYTTELTHLLAYYIHIILGLDADSYALLGGTPYFQKAFEIVNAAVTSPNSGWSANENSNKNRYWLAENLTNERFRPWREAFYKYHIKGLDIMNKDLQTGRGVILECLTAIQAVNRSLPNSMWAKVFFNAKSDELSNMFKQALAADKRRAKELLKDIDPSNIKKWDAIN